MATLLVHHFHPFPHFHHHKSFRVDLLTVDQAHPLGKEKELKYVLWDKLRKNLKKKMIWDGNPTLRTSTGREETSARGSIPARSFPRVTGRSAQTVYTRAGGGRPTVSLETGRKRPEAALRLAAAECRSWGWSSRRKAATAGKRTRLAPWSGRRRGRPPTRGVRPGPRSPAASLGVKEEGGAGERPGRRRRPLGCDFPRPSWSLPFSRICQAGPRCLLFCG